ncbi:hypothetical protein BKP37_15235 [Anaerobacillus alkalilacustris]|uniref:Uncharacterized protein n=1 Tax=Anaerobacillus alkalilacustris TaxID=393763 RepID=A0A1S2LHT4_9BACI|nr:GerAB/ArcD/ProY family transporter [Anaerobacillus alkalilacustris]OIJ11790.1 hypothetical protein BKP37_15235 [Anaerobacillus alkalilacustris]
MEKIANYQLFSLMYLYQVGTTIIFGFTGEAGRDAWITVLISMSVGFIIVFGNMLLMRLNPGLTLVEWYPKQFGKWLGVPIAWLYALLFIYNCGRMIADLKLMIPQTLLPTTHPMIFLSLFTLLIAYGLYLGIEVVGRLAVLSLLIILILFMLETGLIFISGNYDFRFILPIAEEGIVALWRYVWPAGITQSFGEIFVFGMVWPLVKDQKSIAKVAFLSTLLTGLLLSFGNFLAIISLGPIVFERSFFPLYVLLRQINLGVFLQNLDVLAVIYFMFTIFFKVFITMFAVIRSIQILTFMKSSRKLIIPISILVLFVGYTMTDNQAEHIAGVHMTIATPYLWVPFYLILPSLLLIVTMIRAMITKRKTTLNS